MQSITLAPKERKDLIRMMKRERRPSKRLRMHIVLLCADGRSPTEISRVLFCSPTTVYAIAGRFVVQSVNGDIEVPTALGFDLRHTDRIAMLVRTDEGSNLAVAGKDSGHFETNCELPTAALGPIEIVRGWTYLDLRIRGKVVRFINTHLDGVCADPAIQLAQAREVLQGPVQDARDKDILVVSLGDLNSKADGSGTPTYAELLMPSVGFVDAWTEAGGGPGFTCQNDDLLNTDSVLGDRRDYVLVRRGPFKVSGAQLVGASPEDRTPSGLWPSDHAGVVVRLRLPSE